MDKTGKERIALSGEVVRLRDPSDRADHKLTADHLRSLSAVKTSVTDAKYADGDESELGSGQQVFPPNNVLNVEGLPLPVFAARLRAKRASEKTHQPSREEAA